MNSKNVFHFCRAFTSICYSADGEYIIAAGRSKYACIYHVSEGILIKKFEITQNRSLDAVDVRILNSITYLTVKFRSYVTRYFFVSSKLGFRKS